MDYAPYIIAAYGVTAFVLIALGLRSYLLLRKHKKEWQTLQQEDVSKEETEIKSF